MTLPRLVANQAWVGGPSVSTSTRQKVTFLLRALSGEADV